jgi:hypothetical protein
MSEEKTYYSGSQWAVTDYGIEQLGYYQSNGQWRDGWYFMPAEILKVSSGVVEHMAGKDWVDVADFKRAFEVAKRLNT